LTDEATGDLTDILVYKSITNEIADDGVSFKPYLGAPILFYGILMTYSLKCNTVSFVDADGVTEATVRPVGMPTYQTPPLKRSSI
jgi:hypothetical protein